MAQRTYFIMASAFTPDPKPGSRGPRSRVVSWEVTYNEGGADVEVGHSSGLLDAYFFCGMFHRQEAPANPLVIRTFPEDLMDRIHELLA